MKLNLHDSKDIRLIMEVSLDEYLLLREGIHAISEEKDDDKSVSILSCMIKVMNKVKVVQTIQFKES